MRIHFSTLFSLACSPVDNIPSSPVNVRSTDAGTTQLLDPNAAPVGWKAPAGHSWATITALGDITGDGVGDASVLTRAVEVSTDSNGEPFEQQTTAAWLIAGPLRRDVQLPGDALGEITVPGVAARGGDATGDGIADLWLDTVAGDYLIPGPVLGSIGPDSIALDLPATKVSMADINGDGVLDWMKPMEATTELRFGPYERWSNAEPDVTVSCDCADPEPMQRCDVYPIGDLDGDGQNEAWTGGMETARMDSDCYGFVFTLPPDGKVAVSADANVRVSRLATAGDQNGDGVTDLLTGGPSQSVALGPAKWSPSSSPIGFVDPVATDGWQVAAELGSLFSSETDWSGDGLDDFFSLVVDETDPLTDQGDGYRQTTHLAVSGGNASITSSKSLVAVEGWHDGPVVEEDGIHYVFAVDSDARLVLVALPGE